MFTCLKKPLQSSSCKNCARVNSQDCKKKLPTHGTNQIAGFGAFPQITNLEKNNTLYFKLHPLFMYDFSQTKL